MQKEVKRSLISFFIELLIYAVLVIIYYFLVLRLLGGWLLGLFQHDRRVYAVTALGLIICQGLLLEVLTRLLLGFIKPRTEVE